MKNKILISTVFISNIIFASPLPYNTNQASLYKNVKRFSGAVSMHLYQKGLDRDVAHEKVSQFVIGGDFENDLMAQNILNNFDTLKYDNLISYIAETTLYSKKVDLSSYETLIGVFQKLDKVILDKQTLAKIEKVSLENEKIRLLYGV